MDIWSQTSRLAGGTFSLGVAITNASFQPGPTSNCNLQIMYQWVVV